jgi:arylsulfate sulfotransferase
MLARHITFAVLAAFTHPAFSDAAAADPSSLPRRHGLPNPPSARGHASRISVALTPSPASPSPAGAVITWTASTTRTSGENLWYRFRVRTLDGDFRVVRDYGPDTSLTWATTREGTYEMEVSVRDRATGGTAVTSALYQVSSPVSGDQPVVAATSNPLLFLYSAPPCQSGYRLRVNYQSAGGPLQQTPFQDCVAGSSLNFYIAGLLAQTAYQAWHVIDTGSQLMTGPRLGFRTADSGAPAQLFTQSVIQPAAAASGILLASSFVAPAATDLNGNLIWYASNGISFITSVEPGGTFWGIVETAHADASLQRIRKFDLAGTTLLETNGARVNEQLAAMGRRPISAFHHDVKTLADGCIVALASVEQILTDVQGPGPVDILGDMVIVLDRELNVVWTWDTFDHLDVKRAAVLGEVCTGAGGGCPPYNLAANANDWTHGNSIQQTPDGHLLYSSRHQDWLIKINYNNGEGDGGVIWRLGKDGDFRFNSDDPYPWFSHQHDANFPSSDASTLLVFDNGNTRIGANQTGNSRGQAIHLDEQSRTADLVLNADLGVYSLALGTAQKLPNGNYNFNAGYVMDPSSPAGSSAYAVDVDAAGKVVYKAKANGIVYRWIRMTDLYTPAHDVQ